MTLSEWIFHAKERLAEFLLPDRKESNKYVPKQKAEASQSDLP